MSQLEKTNAVDQILERIGPGIRVDAHQVFLVHRPELCLPLILEAIESAQTEIVFEIYWLASDATGKRFAQALAERARAGVSVYVSYDALGSWGTRHELFDMLRKAGCHVASYHTVSHWLKRFELNILNQRNHRKMLVIDGLYAMTGSINIGNEWMPVSQGGAGWRDDAVWVIGPVASEMRDLFFRSWKRMQPGFQLKRLKAFPSRLRRDSLPAPTTEKAVQVLYSSRATSRRSRRNIRKYYLDTIARATNSIFITNSYFVPDRQVRLALSRAARRGVDVQVIVPGKSDVPAVQYASSRMYGKLLRSGVKIFEYDAVVLHAKTASIDNKWSTVGSYNLDYRSWLHNLEMNLAFSSEAIAKALCAQFQLDLKQSRQIELPSWKKRPLKQRLLESFFFTFRRLL